MKEKIRLVVLLTVSYGTLIALTMGAAPDQKQSAAPTKEEIKDGILAGAPGEMHRHLNKSLGVWKGKSKVWMEPGGKPIESECTSTVSPIMEGRFTKCEMIGEMPGIGAYRGLGLYGFDNASQKFTCTWIDNQGTSMMNGTGEISEDRKTLWWNFTVNCPLTGKPTVVREVETTTGSNTKTLDMYSTDPKSGKEYKMMSIEFTKA